MLLWTTIQHRAPDASSGLLRPQEAPQPQLIASDSLREAAPASGLPRLVLAIDPDNATDMHVASDLRRIAAPDASVELDVQSAAPSFSKDAPQSLALMRYEALQVLRKDPGASADALRVILPLYTEEIYFIVRRDSPLTFIHEVEQARINIGQVQSSRRLTVARLYEAMFGTQVPAANLSYLADDEALKKLVNDRSVDVVVVVAAQPSKVLANLSSAIAGGIKLLKLDTQNPASQRAIDVFLPTSVRAANYSAWLREDTRTLATMAFLVTTGSADAEGAERVETFTRSLCRKLPLLRLHGHPKWREVQPGFEVDAGWPYSPFSKIALHSCEVDDAASASVVRR
jgi:hypothetical protein